ncbi:uncharacterized protein LOC128191871 [Crassostrea angulata]|uniref:uncharacterized protein LOC128191871 n=1 Tax=Magallana angulata TaxID=2784310 RepID=UPI0022B11836|nr:uncharacterized protein LOC128191871 [Crassostrea angulata]
MPKRKPSQPQGDVHVEVEPRTNHGKRKKDRATMDVPQTSNLVPVEHAEVGKVSSIGTTSKEGSGEDPFRVSEANLAGEASRLLRAAISPNTTSAYSTGLNAFEHFRIKANISNIWPPPQDHIVNFIAHLSLNGYAESTARNYIAAIGYQCKINGYLNTTNSFIVSKLLDGLRRLKGKADSRLPITEEILGRIVGALCNICSNTYESKLFTAAYTLVFFAFLRCFSNIHTVTTHTIFTSLLIFFNISELNLTSVWIVGSSIIKHAAIEARVRPGGTSLGLKSMGIELWWQGYGGLKFVDVAKKLRYLATLQDSPQFIVMHCGGNDLGQIPLSKLLYRVKWDIRLMASVFPDCQLVWSFILPRITWRYSQRPRCMEQARNRVNRLAAKEVLACGGRIIRHPQFIGKPQNLYSSDGVHLSKLGNYLFLNNIQGALEYFVRDGSSRHFPVS